MVTIRNIDNPFKLEEAQVKELEYSRSKTIEEYLKAAGFAYEDRRVIVTGRRILDLSEKLECGDEITVIPEVKAPVVAIISAIISAVWAVAVAHPYPRPAPPRHRRPGNSQDEHCHQRHTQSLLHCSFLLSSRDC